MKIKSQSGLIAFFDILGYQQMLLNNEVEKTAHLIVDVMSNIPSEVIKNLLGDQGLPVEEGLKTQQFINDFWQKVLKEEIEWLLFSDSILISLPIDSTEEKFLFAVRLIGFLYTCAFLQRQMFDRGLPLRGAISFGDFFIQDTYFAGNPIIESYQASESLELSGCVITNRTSNIYNELKGYAKKFNFTSMISLFDQLCIPYLVPKKNGKLEKQLMVNWINLPMNFFKVIPPDIREYVFSSFVEYNKDTPPVVYPKINNTETYIRYILKNVKSSPWLMWSKERDEYLQTLMKERNI